MNIKQIFDFPSISGCVPIAIQELGYAYLNDTGIWNITINSTHKDCINNSITVNQLKDILKNHSRCFKTSKDRFEKELPKLIEILGQYDLNEKILFQ